MDNAQDGLAQILYATCSEIFWGSNSGGFYDSL